MALQTITEEMGGRTPSADWFLSLSDTESEGLHYHARYDAINRIQNNGNGELN